MARVGTTPTNGQAVILYNTTLSGAGDAGGAATVSGAGFGDPMNSANVTLTSTGVTYSNVPNVAHCDRNLSVCWQYVNSTANAGSLN
jgi:hypothetical protein